MGHIIGTHSHSHPNIFRDLNYVEKIQEWKISKEILEDILKEKILTASIPGGDMDLDTIRAAGEIGIKYLFTSEPNFNPYKKYGVLVLGRVCAKNTTSPSDIRQWSQGKGYLKARFIRFVKEFVRMRLKLFYKIHVKRNQRLI